MGIFFGVVLFIWYELELGDYVWSGDFYIIEFKVCYGEWYIIMVGVGLIVIVFFMRLFKNFFDKMLCDDDNFLGFIILEFECIFLGLLKVFIYLLKVGEKI